MSGFLSADDLTVPPASLPFNSMFRHGSTPKFSFEISALREMLIGISVGAIDCERIFTTGKATHHVHGLLPCPPTSVIIGGRLG